MSRAVYMTTDDRYVRAFAADWHGGQWSALYALASTGGVVEGIKRELLDIERECETAGDGGPWRHVWHALALDDLDD